MKNKKIIIIILIVLILLLAIGAGGFAFVYFKTDLFKSPKDLFYKYVGQSFKASEDFDYDKFLSDYKSISEKSYKSTGEINLDIKTDISDTQEIADILNKSKLTYNLSRIPKEEKSYITIGATYDNKEFTRFEGLSTNNSYGIKCGDLYDKYIYIENDNLQELCKKFGINSSSIPDKIKKIDTYDLLYISKDTRNKIKETYYNIIDKKLDANKFTTNKNVETSVNGETLKTNSYSLELTQKETDEILIAILETLKNDDLTLDLILEKAEQSNIKDSFEQSINYRSSYYSYFDVSSTSETITLNKDYLKEQIQDLIDSLNDDIADANDSNKIKLTVYSYKGSTVKLDLEIISDSDDTKNITLEITKNKNSNNVVSINVDNEQLIKIDYTKTKEKFSGTATINYDSISIPIDFDIESSKTSTKSYIKFSLPSEEVFGTSENYFTDDVIIEYNSDITGELGKGTNSNTSYISISSGENSAKLNIKADITYTDDITISDLNSNNGSCLNTMSVSEIENALKEIISNYKKILPEKLEILGVNSSTSNEETNNQSANSQTDNDLDVDEDEDNQSTTL